jgi:hypothetical protein
LTSCCQKCLVGLNAITKEAWNTAEQSTQDNREKIQALSLAKECHTICIPMEIIQNTPVPSNNIAAVH